MYKMREKVALFVAAVMLLTNIQIPAFGADSTVYVYKASQLVSALNGWDTNGKLLPEEQKIRIQMQAPLTGDDYSLTSEMLGGQNLMVKEGLDVTLDMNGNNIYVSANAVEYDIEVPENTSLNIESVNHLIYTGIVNRGNLAITGTYIYNDYAEGITYGDTIVNHAGAVANLENTRVFCSDENSVAIRNAGSMTIGKDSKIQTFQKSYVAVENTGKLIINDVTMKVELGTVSDCALVNRTVSGAEPAEVSIRGCYIDSRGYALYNDGGYVTIGGFGYNKRSSLYGNRYDVLTVNGGTIVGYDGMNVGGYIATTPFAGNEVYGGTTDGTFKMLGGEVDDICYSEDSLPILVGGVVGDISRSTRAFRLMTDMNKWDYLNVSRYFYLREENGTPIPATYVQEDGITAVAHAVVDGVVYAPIVDVDDGQSHVKTEEELIAALADDKVIAFDTDISISQNLIIDKDAVIKLYGRKWGQSTPDGGITIKEGVDVEIVGMDSSTTPDIFFDNMKEGASAITNYGNLKLTRLNVTASQSDSGITGAAAITNHGDLEIVGRNRTQIISVSVKNGTAIENTGNLNITGVQIYGTGQEGVTAINNSGTCILTERVTVIGTKNSDSGNATGIRNSGTCIMQGVDSSYENKVCAASSGSAGNCTAVYNTGKFVMYDGTIRVDYPASSGADNRAVVYTGENYPMIEGTVLGDGVSERHRNKSPVYDSAVMRDDGDGVYSKGYFYRVDEDVATLIDGRNVYRIDHGIPDYTISNAAGINYLLLEKGDTIEHVEEAFTLSTSGSNSTDVLKITSTDEDVAEVVAAEDGWTLTAKKAGYATIKAEYQRDEDELLEDYLRIEVTEDMTELTEDDYEGSLLQSRIVVEAYGNENMSWQVPFEVHLNTSEMATGASYSDAVAKSFEVCHIIIDDKEFQKYFTYTGLGYDGTSKSNILTFRNNTINDGESTKLLADEVKSIRQVEIKAKINNKATGKEVVVPLGYLDINVQAVRPVVKANKGFTLNSVYNKDAKYYMHEYTIEGGMEPSKTKRPNYQNVQNLSSYISADGDVSSLTIKDVSEGLSLIDNDRAITAIAKKGNESINTEIKLAKYVGTYRADIPVSVINKSPKVELSKKTITVSQRASTDVDIPLYAWSKDAESACMIENVEIVTAKGKTSNYTLNVRQEYLLTGDQFEQGYKSQIFHVQPKSIVNKAETVTLKVTYRDLKANAVKAYSSTVKLKIKPVKNYTIKQSEKADLCTTSGNFTYVKLKTTPEYFEGATLRLVSMNGVEIPQEVAGEQIESCGDGVYKVRVSVKDGTEALGKKLQFGVGWMAPNGKLLENVKVAKMTVALHQTPSAIKTVSPCIVVRPDKIYKKLTHNDYGAIRFGESDQVIYTAPLKFYGNDADAWEMTFSSNNLFRVYYHDKKIMLEPYATVASGAKYTVPLVFTNTRTGDKQTINLTVKIKEVKKVTAKFDTDTVTLYKDAPYVMQMLTTGVGGKYTPNLLGGAGLRRIKKVEIVNEENSPFELYEYKTFDTRSGHYSWAIKEVRQYGLSFKDKVYPTNVSRKALKTVTLKITYETGVSGNDVTSTVRMKVNLK